MLQFLIIVFIYFLYLVKICSEKIEEIKKYNILIDTDEFANIAQIRYIMKIKTKEGTHKYTIVDAKENKSIIIDYILSYILPLFVFDFTHLEGVVMFLIFFITLGFLCIKHNNFCVNIIFEIVNYRFYSCTLKNEDNVEINRTIISRSRLKSNIGNVINLKLLNNEFCIDIKKH